MARRADSHKKGAWRDHETHAKKLKMSPSPHEQNRSIDHEQKASLMKLADLHFEDVVHLKMHEQAGKATSREPGEAEKKGGMRRSMSFTQGVMKRHQGVCMAMIPGDVEAAKASVQDAVTALAEKKKNAGMQAEISIEELHGEDEGKLQVSGAVPGDFVKLEAHFEDLQKPVDPWTRVTFQRRGGCQIMYVHMLKELKTNWPDPVGIVP